jgi:hypothetical protein
MAMTDTDLQSQLEDLKQQVAAISAARQSSSQTPEPEAAALSDDGETVKADTGPEPRQPLEEIEELVHLLEKELHDNPVLSGLAIFVAGLLVGRLMR